MGWRPEDFESPIVFVWLTKTKKESLYAVHESSPTVKYHLQRLHGDPHSCTMNQEPFSVMENGDSRTTNCCPGIQRQLLVCTQLTKYYVANGEWRFVNGERSWTCGQGSTIPATPSGVPSSRMEIQGQWTITDLSDRWRMENGQWSLRII